ncbi:hypothetical protein BYT27DRAFT_7236407 [Phlegmacium glaucopus]|nr:hypothetical protein BYT27DRAFT_7236407 [Phlegmacium glaucopus]
MKKTEREETKIALKSKSTLKGSSTTSGKKSGKKKGNDSDTDDDDLEGILEKMRKEWEEAHTVTEELLEGPPTCPNGGHLWCIGGEFFSEDGQAVQYTPEKDKWCKFISPTCPGPRSAHAVAVSLAGGRKIFLFSGEFSSLHQNTFHHYPRYLNDLWLFNMQEYKWNQVEFREMDAKPSPCSGFSFLPCANGIILHGGYCKEYAKGKPMLLSISSPFHCVTDEDTNKETLESVFCNDLYGYQLSGKGKWSSMTLKKTKSEGWCQKDKDAKWKEQNSGGEEDDEAKDEVPPPAAAPETPKTATLDGPDPTDPLLTAPLPRYNTMLAVLRSTLYIYGGIYEHGSRKYTLDNFYSLQLDKMDKYICLKESDVVILDGDIESNSDEDEDKDDDSNDDDDDDNKEEEEERDGDNAGVDKHDEADEEEDELCSQATTFMGVSKNTTRSLEDIQSTPLPGETLAMQILDSKAHGNSDNQGKQLHRDGFTLAEEQYTAYKPILAEVEKRWGWMKKR